MKPNNDHIQELMERVNHSPYPQHMSMLMTAMDLDTAVIEMQLSTCHMQAYGIVHGGVLATLIDTATFWAVYLRIPEDAGLVNIDLKLNYLKPVTGGLLTAEARAIRSGKSISYAEARVLNDKGEIIVHGTSTLMTLPGKALKLTSPKFIDTGV